MIASQRPRTLLQRHGAAIIQLGFVVDGALILLSLCGALALREIPFDARHLMIGIGATLLFQVGAAFSNLNRSGRVVRLRHELREVAALWSGTFCVTVGAVLLSGALDASRTGGHRPAAILAAWYGLTLAGIALFRIAMRMMLRYYRAFGHDHRGVAIIGATQTARDLMDTFKRHPWMGIDVVGVYADDAPAQTNNAGVAVAGPIVDLVEAARRRAFDAIYVTLANADEEQIKYIVDCFGDTTMPIYYCPPLQTTDLISRSWDDIGGHPVVSIVESPFSGLDRHLKRLEDLVLVALFLPLAILIMLPVAAAIKLTSPGPVFYRQTRYGLDGREFQIWKFRTMSVTETDDGFRQARRGDPRVTKFGRILRNTSIDELPQLLNVVTGDMSVVGPRPHPVKLNEDHRRIIPRYMLRHMVKPGITGWAQVNGCRGETETVDVMRTRIEYDLQYIQNWSIWTDALIIVKTIGLLVRRSDAY